MRSLSLPPSAGCSTGDRTDRKMFPPKSICSVIFYPVGKLFLGPYYRHQLFPSGSRGKTTEPVGWGNDFLPLEHEPALHIVRYSEEEYSPTRKVFIFMHGRSCSASAAAQSPSHSSTAIVQNLFGYGLVYGVNQSGYEKTRLTKGRLATESATRSRCLATLNPLYADWSGCESKPSS